MTKNYSFNSISLDAKDGVYESLFNLKTNKTTLNLSEYPLNKLLDYMFYENSTIKEVILPEGITEIVGTSLYKFTNLENINIPKSVSKITKSQVFLKDSKIYNDEANWKDNCFIINNWLLDLRSEEAIIPSSVNKLGSDIENKTVKTLTLSKNITEIPEYFFYYNSVLEKLNIPADSKLISIKNYSFYNCKSLKEIYIPKSVREISNYAFDFIEKIFIDDLGEYCKIDLSKYSFDALNGNRFNTYDLYLKNTLLRNVIIPEDVLELKPYTFAGANLETITLPNTVKRFKSNSLIGYFTSIIFNGTISEWRAITKDSNSVKTGIYVQCSDGQIKL